MNKARFEAFSDGVFAFAFTLLVLGFALPEFREGAPDEAALTRALLHLWPNLIAYVLSFMVIGIMWQNHHALFRLVHAVDRTTVVLNLMLMAVVAFIPFATSALGSYPTLRPAAFLYGLTLTTAALAYNVLLTHLVRRRAFAAHVSETTLGQTVRTYRIGLATYAIATLVALAEPVASFAFYLLIALYFLIPRGVDADRASAPP